MTIAGGSSQLDRVGDAAVVRSQKVNGDHTGIHFIPLIPQPTEVERPQVLLCFLA